jgi:cell wall-associated NlpC family hydrolase
MVSHPVIITTKSAFFKKKNVLKSFAVGLTTLFLPYSGGTAIGYLNDFQTKSWQSQHESFQQQAAPVQSYQLRHHLARYAARQRGVRYRYGKENRKDGFDCSGLMRYVFKKYAMEIPKQALKQAQFGKKVPISQARTGDLVFFGYGRSVSHVGMVFSNDTAGLVIVHASSSRGVVVENISKQKYWMRQLRFAADILGV